MTHVSNFGDVDPTFTALAKALYGDAYDVRELWDLSKNLDAADVHTNAPIKARKKLVPAKQPRSKAAAGLELGAVAESLGTYRAGQGAVKAIRETEPATRAVRLRRLVTPSAASPERDVGEFGLQAANLAVGLGAAHELNRKAKQRAGVAKKITPLKTLRPVRNTIDPEHLAALKEARSKGNALLAAGGIAGALLVGHHEGIKTGMKRAGVAKGALPAAAPPGMKTLARGVRDSNAGGIGTLTRRGRSRAGNGLPTPKLVPLGKSFPMEYEADTGLVRLAHADHVARGVQHSGDCQHCADISKSITWTGTISKIDEEHRQVFGWASVSEVDGEPVVDQQDDWVPIEEIEKSAYTYVLNSRLGGDMHRRVSKFATDAPLHTADLIESFMSTPEKLEKMGLAPDALPHGWWTGFQINDEQQWQDHKKGKRPSFSIHGSGVREKALM